MNYGPDQKGKPEKDDWMIDIKDSKLLSPTKREKLTEIIKRNSDWAVGVVSESVIDEINIHNASLLAMQKALDELHTKLKFEDKNKSIVLVDGKFRISSYIYPQEAIVDGDAKVFSVAAASIIAKVYRDSLMRNFDKQFPDYKFAAHKGYGTLAHREAIKKLGLCPIHRKSFRVS